MAGEQVPVISMVVHTCNPRTREPEVAVEGLEANTDCTARPCLKKGSLKKKKQPSRAAENYTDADLYTTKTISVYNPECSSVPTGPPALGSRAAGSQV